MPLVLNTNIMSLNSQNALNRTQNAMQTSMQRLSTGLRINSASDDAAGFAVSTRMTTQLNGLDQARRNANDGISMLQTATGGINQIISNLQQISSLAIEAGNPTMSDDDRTNLNAVAQQLLKENNRIVKSTNFNGVNLLGGSSMSAGLDSSTKFQVGVENSSASQVTLSGLSGFSAGFGLSALGLSAISLSAASAALSALDTVKSALKTLTTAAAQIGAVQNRFQAVVQSIQQTSTDLTAARSQIVDVDYAAETANLTKTQIMQQAGVAMVAQANQIPQSILKLLQ